MEGPFLDQSHFAKRPCCSDAVVPTKLKPMLGGCLEQIGLASWFDSHCCRRKDLVRGTAIMLANAFRGCVQTMVRPRVNICQHRCLDIDGKLLRSLKPRVLWNKLAGQGPKMPKVIGQLWSTYRGVLNTHRPKAPLKG